MTRTNSHCIRACRLVAALVAVWPASAQEPPPLLRDGAVTLTAVAERSTLDRVTNQLTSTVDLKAVNASGQQIAGPVHMPVKFLDPAGQEVRAGVTVQGASGGFGADPWQLPYFDLSGEVAAGGWQPDQELTWTLSFTRHRAVAVSYLFTPAGLLNRAPQADAGGPYRIAAGESAALAGTATDADGDTLTFVWRFEDGSEATGAATARAFTTPGLHEVTLTVSDGRGGEAMDTGVVAVTPAGEFALAWTRALDGTGHPLADVEVKETGPGGERTFSASAETAFVSLGGLPGAQVWRFSAPGYYPVWRRAVLPAGQVTLIPNPWLAAESEAEGGISILEATTLLDRTRTVKLSFPAGAFPQAGRTLLTSRPEQTLPAELPAGWSPLSAFSFYPPEPGAQEDGTAEVKLPSSLPTGRVAAVTRYDPPGGQWIVLTLLTGAGAGTVSFPIRQSGDYALVLADAAPAVPPPVPNAGEALAGVAVPALPAGSVTAAGRVEPAVRAASEDPDAVTARASVDFAAAGLTLPSGLWFRMDVEETYDLRDGGRFRTPAYDATFFAWRGLTPPAVPAQLQGPFPMRPRLLVAPSLLGEAHLHAVIHAPQDEELVVIDETGGQLSAGDATLTVPAGAAGGLATAQLRTLPPGGLSSLAAGLPVAGAFLLDFANFLPGSVLGFTWRGKLDPLSDYVLARVVNVPGANGLQPVLRLRSDAAGFISGAEPAAPPHLSGIDRAGQYLIVKLADPQGLVSGVVRFQSDNAPASSALVRVSGQPWLGLTPADGRFALLSPEGSLQITAERTVEGFTGRAGAEMAADLAPVSADVLIGSSPPFVVSTSPAADATKVPPVTPVTVTFSERIAPASFAAGTAVSLLNPDGTAVPATLTLDLTNRIASLLPLNPLAPSTDYKIVVSAELRDLQNLALEGPREFAFTTAAPASRGEGAVLTIYEPGGTGPTAADQALINAIPGYTPGTDNTKVVAIGSAGTADAQVPVILVNQSTGETATVLSRIDGSFANFIEASEEDFISAVFVNAEGTRITIPASRQKYDDGRVGLYSGGGILEAESDGGPVQIIVEPNSVPSRTIFRMEPLTLQDVEEITGGVQPEGGKFLPGVKFQEEGDLTRTASDLIFSVNVSDLGLPEGSDPVNATYALTIPRKVEGTIVYEIIDALQFRPTGAGKGELVTASPPFVGLLLREIAAMRQETGISDTLGNTARVIADGAISILLPVGIFAIPVVIADAAGSNVHGTVRFRHESQGNTSSEQEDPGQPLPGALVRVSPPLIDFLPNAVRPGEYVAVSDNEGKYALRLPLFMTSQVVATHRRFPFQTQRVGFANAGLISGLRGDFMFTIPLPENLDIPDTSRPLIEVRQLSSVATIGSTPDAGMVVDVTAFDDIKIDDVTMQLTDFTTLVGNQSLMADLSGEEQAALQPTLILSDDDINPARSHERYRVQSRRLGRAEYSITATDGSTVPAEFFYTIVFNSSEPSPEAGVERRVSFVWPPNAAVFSSDENDPSATRVARGTPIRIRFSIPLEQGDAEDTSWLTLGPEGVNKLHVEVSPDRREAVVSYWVANETIDHLTMSISPQVVNQEPVITSIPGAEEEEETMQPFNGYMIRFVKPPALTVPDNAQIENVFSGVVQTGNRVYVLQRNNVAAGGFDSPGKIVHYQIVPSTDGDLPSVLEKVGEVVFPPSFGRPQDLVLAPSYPIRRFDGSVDDEETFLIVYAGDILSPVEGVNALKKAHIYTIGDDGTLSPMFVGGNAPVLSEQVATVTRARWDPPFLGYLETGSENTAVVLATLNGLITGREAVAANFFTNLAVGQGGQIGLDVNNDGDFVDAGETAPIPAKQPGVLQGLEFSFAPLNPQDRISDYDFSADFGLLGATFRNAATGQHGFMMILGGPIGQVDDETARVNFPEDPKRVQLLPRQPLLEEVTAAGGGVSEIVRDVALVSCVNFAPGETQSVLIVVDITNPVIPAILGRAKMPPEIGTLNSIVPRGDGLFTVSTTPGGLFVLDPRLLLMKDAGGVTAAIRQQIEGLETNVRTFVANAAGLNFGNLGGKVTAALSQPAINVVRFDGMVPEAAKAIAEDIAANLATASSEWDQRLLQMVNVELNAGARTFDKDFPNDPRSHFYVVVQAPGDVKSPKAGDPPGSIRLAAASIQETGLPLLPAPNNRAPTFVGEEQITKELVFYGALKVAHFLADINFEKPEKEIIRDLGRKMGTEVLTPEKLIQLLLEDAPDYPSDLLAHRLSHEPASPLYNTFLAGPIVLCHKDAPVDFVAADQADGGVRRTYLRASPYYWVGLAPSQRRDPLVGPFASTQIENIDLTLDIDLTKLTSIFNKAKGVVQGFSKGGLANLILKLTTLVDAELERSMHPGHVALVNFGFRRNPVIFIPGVMASRLRDLEAEEGKDARWVSVVAGIFAHIAQNLPSAFTPDLVIDGLRSRVNALTMGLDGQPQTELDTEDILRRLTLQEVLDDLSSALSGVPVIGPLLSGPVVSAISPLLGRINKPIYQPLLLYLHAQHGYTEYTTDGGQKAMFMAPDGEPSWQSLKTGPDLFIYPYDWRQDNKVAADNLKKYVKLINAAHPDTPRVDIVAHSMGGLVARRFVLDNPGKVDRFISICSPFLGATKALYAARTGDFDEMAMSVLIPPPRLRVIARHMPAVHQLMPSEGLFRLGLRPLRERGWNLDGDDDATEALEYGDYRTAMDGAFLQLSPDMLPQQDEAGATEDLVLLNAPPKPIATNNEPFFNHTGTGSSAGNQYNWNADTGDVRYIHFVCLQSVARTISTLEARPVLIPEKLKPNVSLTLPPVEFFESEERLGVDLPILPETTVPIEIDEAKAYKLTWTPEILRGAGDVTVPFLSQSRGFGSDIKFHAPGTQMYPLLNPDGKEEHDEKVSHNGVFTNPQLWAWVGKALDDAIVAESQPKVTVGGGGGAVAGTAVTFSAAITNPPQNANAPLRIYWDMGDGTVLTGLSVPHVYRDAGDYTVSVCVSWEPGVDAPGDLSEIVKRPTFAATGARQITVTDGSPPLAIEGPGTVEPGELATFRVNVSGFFGSNVEQFLWNFGDGSTPGTSSPQNYVVEHVFYTEGDFQVSCTLVDEAGSSSTVSTGVTVSLPSVAPLLRGPRGQQPPPPPDAPHSPADVERLEIKVTGHLADSDALEIEHDGRTVYNGNATDNSESAVSRLVATEPGEVTRPSVEYIDINRATYVNGAIEIPDETTISLEGEQPRMRVRMRHIKPGSPPRCYSFAIAYDEDELFEGNAVFRIKWNDLPALTAETLPSIFEPGGAYALEESHIERWDDRPPSLNFSNDDNTDRLNISTADDTKPVNTTANLDDTELVVGLPGPPPIVEDAAPGGGTQEGLPSLDGTQVYKAITKSATSDAPPGLVVASDAQQNPRTPDKDDCPIDVKPLTIADIEAIQNSVKSVFLEAGQSPFFRQFIFSFNDLWILEQGSGALLWKSTDPTVSADVRKASLEKLRGVYVKGKSDNDYEIFLPVFKKTSRQLNPADQSLFEAFPRLAHQPEYMTGDWYFKRPRGITAGGADLGPPPDPDDREAFQRYVAAAATWRYDTLGVGAPEIDTLELWSGLITKGEKPFNEATSVFDQPATPAEVISHILTHLVKSNPTRRKVLPDVSFFPFRREHLAFACLSLEKPPPFGDDPVGDAGMGRQLLLMKWLLEGAFLPPFDSFNAAASLPAGTRGTLFDRLKQRESLMAVEGYEWGLYQQWAILRDNAHFRVRPQGANDAQAAAAHARARCREVFGNFLDKHDEKVMKKVGKAGIRAALGRLAIDDIERALLLDTSPAEFDADPALRSFEHYIARRAIAADEEFFGGADGAGLIQDFLRAKVGDPLVFCDIRERPDGVDQFIFDGNTFLQSVQLATAGAYEAYRDELITAGRINEVEVRMGNAQAIDYGFTGVTGNSQPGRIPLIGDLLPGEAAPELKYSFIVALSKNQTTAPVEGIRVVLQTRGEQAALFCPPLGEDGLTFPAPDRALTIKHVDADDVPVLTLRRNSDQSTNATIRQHEMTILLDDDELDQNPDDNTARLESEILQVPHSRSEELVPEHHTRWVYRGIKFQDQVVGGQVVTADQQIQNLIDQQLRQGVFLSRARLVGVPDDQAVQAQLDHVQQRIDAGQGLEQFSNADLQVMNARERVAVSHLGFPPNSPGISTAEDLSTAIAFANTPNPTGRSLLLSFEVPVEPEGVFADPAAVPAGSSLQYVQIAAATPDGRQVLRLVNEVEGREVVFFHEIQFLRCVVIEILPAVTLEPGDFFLVQHLGTFAGNQN